MRTLNSAPLTGTPTAPTPALGDNTTKISTTAFVQGTVNGLASVNVSGGANVTLTSVQAGNGILVFTGALTANISVIVANTTKTMIVENLTSGAFTLTVKTAAGTGIAISQGKTQEVFCDGTNVLLSTNDFVNVALTGTPTAPTAAPGTNTTQVSTTAFVTAAVAAVTTGFAPINSAPLTGVPTAPTATAGTTTTQLATTAFVTGAISTASGNYALLAGSSSQVFSVAPATLGPQAMQLQQKGFTLRVAAGTAGTYSYTVPTGVYFLFYKLWGGGAGGGGGSTGAQSGNGAGTGAYAEGWLAVTPGQVIPYVIGPNGNGGAGTGLGGANGGSSSLNTSIVCTGGIAGSGGGTGGGSGGTASGGDINIPGGQGTGPALVNAAGTLWYGPPGGLAPGGAAPGATGYGTGPGSAGKFPGGGGSGGAGGSAGAFQGGAGAVGALYLWG